MKEIIVIKFGGSLGRNEKARKTFLKDFASLSKRNKVVLVHGGGPEINHWLSHFGIKSRFVHGLRFTDAASLGVVEMVLSGKVNKALVADLVQRGVRAVGISAKDGKTVVCRRIKNLGFVGEPRKVDGTLLKTLLNSGFVPIISSLAIDQTGQTLNVNADLIAMSVAAALKAQRLILLTDVPGVLDADRKTMPLLRCRNIKPLLDAGIITGGMIPKIKACVRAVQKGVKEVWIVDGSKGLKKLNGTVIKK